MHTYELVLPMVKVVSTLAQVEVDDADGVDLLHLVVLVAQLHVLRDGLSHPIEDALQVIQLARLLYLHQDDFTLGVASLDVYAVELVVFLLLVAFALQKFHNGHLLVEQHRHQTFQHGEVRLVAKHAFRCPVKPYILIHLLLSLLFVCKYTNKKLNNQNISSLFPSQS